MKLPFARRVAAKKVTPPAVEPRKELPPIVEEAPRPALEPGAADVRRRLLESGVSRPFCDSIVRSVVRGGARGTYAIDFAARLIGATFRTQASPRRSGAPHVIVFVGPPGGGKTTTLAKLGRRLEAAGRGLAYASFDPQSLTALERVGGRETDVDRTEIPLAAVRTATDLRRFLRRAQDAQVVLIDTPGFSPREEREIARFAEELARCRQPDHFETYLVLPASTSRGSLGLASTAFAPLAPDAAVLTKLDETSEPAAALETLLATALPAAFLCDGQDVRGNLVRPTRDHFADLLLRGKLA